MAWFEVVVRLSVLVGIFAIFFTFPMFREHRQQLSDLFSTCPMHWFQDKQQSADQSTESADSPNSIVRTVNHRLFTVDELRQYDGREGSSGLFVAVLGSVYDVSSGRKHYGPDGSYSVFAAKDASRAFVSGDFTKSGLTDDVSGLTSAQWLELLHWFQFYEKSYRYVGKLVGRFYDEKGIATEALLEAQAALDEALANKQKDDDQRKIFPPCNSQWSEASGLVVWCSDMSGGIKRDWDGVPRKFFEAGSQQTRCVCVRNFGQPSYQSLPDAGRGDLGHPSLREYDGCLPHSNTCVVK